MVGAFSLFATMPLREMKEMGIGLAVAVLIDATLVRAVLLPAVMTLQGERNWYLPAWLEWLPTIHAGESERAAGRARRPEPSTLSAPLLSDRRP
jgi:uncharacterized membrane protein YdfJ with MMPL/SSD domain